MRKTIALMALVLLVGAACAKGPVAPTAATAPAATLDAKALYAAKCAGCHAPDGSKGLKGKSADFVVTALKGYQAKTYGGAKKEIMEARAAQLSPDDIKALAGFIAGL